MARITLRGWTVRSKLRRLQRAVAASSELRASIEDVLASDVEVPLEHAAEIARTVDLVVPSDVLTEKNPQIQALLRELDDLRVELHQLVHRLEARAKGEP